MFNISARSKYLDLSKSFRGFYVLILGIFLSILTYLIYQNLIVTVTMGISTIAAFIITSQPPKKIEIKISEQGLDISGEIVQWQYIIGWAMVDLGEDLEFVVQTSKFVKDFYYFYVHEEDPKVKQLLQIFTQFAPYDETITTKNQSHNILRNFGLK